MKYLGLDYGSKRLGISISDREGIIARGLCTIACDEENKMFEQLDIIINENNIDVLVLGKPLMMNGTSGQRMIITDEFKIKLEKRYNKKVVYQDERLSTVEAENILLSNNTRRKNRKKVIDKVASTIILQTYLDRKGK